MERKKCKEKKERKKEEKGGRPTVAWPVFAGGDRSWPEWVDKAPKERVDSGASVVQIDFLEF